eukprot:CAMPEP_0204598976 /NCGR_PEP_ID=MMETSP0661-20131031/54584_1 /ASSEMBLY_ACC=CAM_ASM_000606 /TAXON_ID=109239 /ORGANISM="Alexandrium margalefi, Strain AMGDE01CS-322" /LENGTH=194 /DNA_ID=CAMNT_0051609685 /DNA_START=155 /DNA_END=737 /DNA_ORIENTATION=-
MRPVPHHQLLTVQASLLSSTTALLLRQGPGTCSGIAACSAAADPAAAGAWATEACCIHQGICARHTGVVPGVLAAESEDTGGGGGEFKGRAEARGDRKDCLPARPWKARAASPRNPNSSPSKLCLSESRNPPSSPETDVLMEASELSLRGPPGERGHLAAARLAAAAPRGVLAWSPRARPAAASAARETKERSA